MRGSVASRRRSAPRRSHPASTVKPAADSCSPAVRTVRRASMARVWAAVQRASRGTATGHAAAQGSRPIMWYSRLGSIPIAEAMRLVKLYITAGSTAEEINLQPPKTEQPNGELTTDVQHTRSLRSAESAAAFLPVLVSALEQPGRAAVPLADIPDLMTQPERICAPHRADSRESGGNHEHLKGSPGQSDRAIRHMASIHRLMRPVGVSMVWPTT